MKIFQTWFEVIDMRIQNFSVPPQEVTKYLFDKSTIDILRLVDPVASKTNSNDKVDIRWLSWCCNTVL